ncbi:hypothetical protein ARAM_000942 [Aspergillus rambellii]|uniref:F-box domain-containing protein n=1 Tax=Aspergillus rambellii TaxID=308745 RepID=A0A0F8TZP8_9EURO|nr:hypothetical protein ARAM_000942 [Aspergillus rambellii]
MLLSELPPEIVYLIAKNLPTASALAHLAQTCHRLHEIVAGEDWWIFRAFVHSQFPGIQTPPFWKDVAQALTSRSRALDRHGIIGRFILRPAVAGELGGSRQATRGDNPTHGYRPAIDSYEIWNGSSWHDRKEVLAWGAAHELFLRVKQYGRNQEQEWVIFNDLQHISSHDDICGIHILRPEHASKTSEQEHLILARMRGELIHLAIAPKDRTHEYRQKFITDGLEIERTDMSDGLEPILAAHLGNGTVAFYSTTTGDPEVEAFARLRINAEGSVRNKCSKFLSPTHFAVGTGRSEDAIAISTISQERVSLDREISAFDLDTSYGLSVKNNVTALAPLNGQIVGGSPGTAFLAAWGDGAVRLHDLRSHRSHEMTYKDIADENPTYCIHPFGHDRFIAGAGGDAVVKIFDLRMAKTYSYQTARANSPKMTLPNRPTYPSKDFSIFLSHLPPTPLNTLSRHRGTRNRYRGPIYTMSSPSLLSPTIYTGIAGGILQLHFVSTDDLAGSNGDWYRDSFDLRSEATRFGPFPNDTLDLSGYERPDSKDTTTCSKLRTQQPYAYVGDDDIANEMSTGWDRRWIPLERPGVWRRQD